MGRRELVGARQRDERRTSARSTVFDDGSGPALYAGGGFTTAGGVAANRIAKWDGASWSALGQRDATASSCALAVFDDGSGPALYAGGDFTTAGGVAANHIAKWDGASWSALGSGMNGSTSYALAVFDDGSGPALYAGGAFTTAGGVRGEPHREVGRRELVGARQRDERRRRCARGLRRRRRPGALRGRRLHDRGRRGGEPHREVGRLELVGARQRDERPASAPSTVFDDGSGPALYAGGGFTTAGGVPANSIAKWDGSSWSALGSGLSAHVMALAVFDDGGGPALYAGGNFTIAGGARRCASRGGTARAGRRWERPGMA